MAVSCDDAFVDKFLGARNLGWGGSVAAGFQGGVKGAVQLSKMWLSSYKKTYSTGFKSLLRSQTLFSAVRMMRATRLYNNNR